MLVGEQAVRKVLDLENVRGIVMAEVGDLDQMLEWLIARALPELSPTTQKEIFDAFHTGADEQHTNRSEALAQFKKSQTVELLLELCDSNKRWANINRVARNHPKLKEWRRGLATYEAEILKPRNFLAHGVANLHSSGGYLFSYGGKTWLYDDKSSKELRTNLMKFRTLFSQMRSALIPIEQ